MEISELAKYIDHTLLKPEAGHAAVEKLCSEALAAGAASVCVSPCRVAQAAGYLNGRVAVCTVVGFPTGCSTTPVKTAEAADAVKNGADEIDMVINIGALKDGELDYVENEIREVKSACQGKPLKVIIECCLLTDDEKLAACRCAMRAGADFVKTSTGFSAGGAVAADVRLMRGCVGSAIGVKAAGGIRTREQAEAMLAAGASRIGSSAILADFGK